METGRSSNPLIGNIEDQAAQTFSEAPSGNRVVIATLAKRCDASTRQKFSRFIQKFLEIGITDSNSSCWNSEFVADQYKARIKRNCAGVIPYSAAGGEIVAKARVGVASDVIEQRLKRRTNEHGGFVP